MIKITIQEHEINNAEMGNYFYLRGEVEDEGYTGWTDFVVAEDDLKSFLNQLKEFSKDFDGTPELKAGWGEEIYFQIRFEKWRSAGMLWVEGKIATPARSKSEANQICSHCLVYGFPLEPIQLDSFISSLFSMVKGASEAALLENS